MAFDVATPVIWRPPIWEKNQTTDSWYQGSHLQSGDSFLLPKINLFSTKIFKPLAAITPKSKIEMPPKTAVGIEFNRADTYQ